jgi:hypothetical protein
MARIAVEAKRIDDRDTRVSNCDSNTTAETKHCGLSSVSLSDQSTIVEEHDVKALEGSELFAVSSSYVQHSTGKRMVKLYYELSLSLDDLKIRGHESRIPESKDDLIEALFHYQGENIWVYVPYSYAKDRMASVGVYRMV